MNSDLTGLAARTSAQPDKIVGLAPYTMKMECGEAAFVKHDAGKPRMSQIPADAEWEVAQALTHGAGEYGPFNWKNGPEWHRYLDAAKRHINKWARGMDIDEDSNTNHLANACANLMLLIACQRRGIGTDDRDKCC